MFPVSKKFFLKREEGQHHGGVKIVACTHLPRIYTEQEALELAAELVETVGLEAAEKFFAARHGSQLEQNAGLEAIAKKLSAAPAAE